MQKKKPVPANPADSTDLFNRVVTILEQARANVVRSVNSTMVSTYYMVYLKLVTHRETNQLSSQKVAQWVTNL